MTLGKLACLNWNQYSPSNGSSLVCQFSVSFHPRELVFHQPRGHLSMRLYHPRLEGRLLCFANRECVNLVLTTQESNFIVLFSPKRAV